MQQIFTEKLSFSEGRCSHGKLRKSDLLNQLWPLALPRIRAYPTFNFPVTDAACTTDLLHCTLALIMLTHQHCFPPWGIYTNNETVCFVCVCVCVHVKFDVRAKYNKVNLP
jgi:hypothetical protein